MAGEGGRGFHLVNEDRSATGDAVGPASFGGRTRARDNTLILLITIDSLRRDRVGCYAGGRSLTPYIDSIAGEGLQFDWAFSHGGETPESFPSLMCSTPPPIRVQDRSIKGKATLARLMKENGLSTAGFHPNPYLSSSFGYEEGFDTFYEGAWSSMPSGVQAMRRTVNQLFFNKGPITNCWSTARMAKDWARRVKGSAFLWVHFMDVHVPYLPPTSATGLGRSMTNRALMAMVLSSDEMNRRTAPTPATKKAMMLAYDACATEVDRCISRLVPEVTKPFSSSLVILTSDHGEAFWEHGYHGHSGVYDDVIRVPFVVRGTGVKQGRVDGVVGLSDVLPTVLDYLGEEAQPVYGSSVLRAPAPGRTIISSSIVPKLKCRFIGVRDQSTKLLRKESMDGTRLDYEAFFRTSTDPLELTNTLPGDEELAAKARLEIDRTYGGAPAAGGAFSGGEEEELLDRFRALGYA